MSRIIKSSEASDARRVALNRANLGKQGAFAALGEELISLEVGDMLPLTHDEVARWNEDVASTIARMNDGTTFTKEQEKALRYMLAAIQRQARKSTTNDKYDLTSEYLFEPILDDKGEPVLEVVVNEETNDDGETVEVEELVPTFTPTYAVRRTK